MEKFVAVNRMYNWGGIWFLSDEQKMSVLNALVEEFISIPTRHPRNIYYLTKK